MRRTLVIATFLFAVLPLLAASNAGEATRALAALSADLDVVADAQKASAQSAQELIAAGSRLDSRISVLTTRQRAASAADLAALEKARLAYEVEVKQLKQRMQREDARAGEALTAARHKHEMAKSSIQNIRN